MKSLSTAASFWCRPLTCAWLRLCVLAMLGLVTPGTARAELPKTSHRYELSAEVDVVKHVVRGNLRLTFRNTSAQPLKSLLFHLYMNAFRDRQSVFMRESGGQLRGDRFEGAGSIELETLTVEGRDALASAERQVVPKDFTQLRAALHEPLAPGGTITIESRFVTYLPPVFARSGHAGDFQMVAQWFPKLAKLEPDGSFAGFPYHALSEFYADFADYRLEVNTPSDVVVGATGSLIEQRKLGGRIIRRFDAPAVHDVAFVTSTQLQTRRKRVGNVELISLYPPGFEFALAEHERVVERGLTHYGKKFGAYPYRTLTMIVPPRGAGGASGMEYPMLFVTGGRWVGIPGVPGLSGAFVTAHELAHQWFQGLLASNEERWPVLDEGLAEWASVDLIRSMWGEAASVAAHFPLSRFEVERLAVVQSAAPAIASNWPASFYTDTEYGRSIYARSAVALETLRRSHGRARFDRALALYSARHRFEHPAPSDLAHAFDDVYGASFGTKVVSPLVFEGRHGAVHVASVRTAREGDRYLTEVRARRTGEVALPTWIAAYAEDGKELKRVRFPAELARIDAMLRTAQPVARVALDPDRALLIDPDTRDQVVYLHAAGQGWGSRLSAWFQVLLASVGP